MDEFYHPHREAQGNEFLSYSDRTIHSPAVPVIRLDEVLSSLKWLLLTLLSQELIEQPFDVSFITTAAPNSKELIKHGVSKGVAAKAMHKCESTPLPAAGLPRASR